MRKQIQALRHFPARVRAAATTRFNAAIDRLLAPRLEAMRDELTAEIGAALENHFKNELPGMVGKEVEDVLDGYDFGELIADNIEHDRVTRNINEVIENYLEENEDRETAAREVLREMLSDLANKL